MTTIRSKMTTIWSKMTIIRSKMTTIRSKSALFSPNILKIIEEIFCHQFLEESGDKIFLQFIINF